jgi:Domain of unknown function (DUF4234)
MTDTPEEHAHPSGAPNAVLEPRPAMAGAPEPPAFGFNAPAPAPAKPEEREADLSGSPAESSGRAGALPAVAEPATVEPAGAKPTAEPPARPFTLPVRPQSSTLAPATAQPRELMPPGKHRSTAAMALFSIITLGIYAIVWHRRVNAEMGDFDPRIHVHPSRSAWAVFLPWFAGLLASAAAAGIVLAEHYGVDLHLGITAHQVLPGVGAIAVVPYLMLFLPFSLVAVAFTAERVRLVEEHAGMTTDEQIRPAAICGWLLMPVIGGLILMGRQQSHLNRIWHLAQE